MTVFFEMTQCRPIRTLARSPRMIQSSMMIVCTSALLSYFTNQCKNIREGLLYTSKQAFSSGHTSSCKILLSFLKCKLLGTYQKNRRSSQQLGKWQGPGKAGSGGQLTPLKLELKSEIGYDSHKWNYFWIVSNNKCIYHLHLGPSILYFINNKHDFKGWGENQRIMLHKKLYFWPWPRCKMVPEHLAHLALAYFHLDDPSVLSHMAVP